MNLEETRNALKQVFEDKLAKTYSKILKGEIETKSDSYAPIRRVGDVILEYLDCGGTIEAGSSFDFAEKVLEQSGSNIKRLNVTDFLKVNTNGVAESLTYDEAITRNSKLTLGEMRRILARRYQPYIYSGSVDIGERLEYMSEFVQCGGIIDENSLYIDKKIKDKPEYLKLYEQIQDKSNQNREERKVEKSPLQQKEQELSTLEAEEKTISKTEALIEKQTGKEGQDIGEN